MNELKLGQPNCYNVSYRSHFSRNLVITFTPGDNYFLYHNDLNGHKICVSSN